MELIMKGPYLKLQNQNNRGQHNQKAKGYDRDCDEISESVPFPIWIEQLWLAGYIARLLFPLKEEQSLSSLKYL